MKQVAKFIINNALLIGGLLLLLIVFFSHLIKMLSIFRSAFDEKNPYDDFKGNVTPDYSVGISASQASKYAMQLLSAFNSREPFYGTDEDLVYKIFSSITPNDFKKIYLEFGQRDYNGYNSPPQGVFRHLDTYEKLSLVSWLLSEIDPVKDKQLYLLVRSVVEPAGFKF
ncbi:hypothetical protein [Tenacibaculum ascidiaceicola]|uniref:hypothetical protein n=1 Tax=Tenacibaculum ascidiaceicola TaxID=1699411 RepID=UPI003892CC87